MIRSHTFNTLPEVFDVTIRMQQTQSDLTIEETIDALKRDESYRLLRATPDATMDAFYTESGRKNSTSLKRRANGVPFLDDPHTECFTKPRTHSRNDSIPTTTKRITVKMPVDPGRIKFAGIVENPGIVLGSVQSEKLEMKQGIDL
jgi:hypothetical protein